MRLISTLNDPDKARLISAYLSAKGIHNQLESDMDNDWGSNNYGTYRCHLWIIEEDQFEEAKNLIDNFNEDDHAHLIPANEVTETKTPKEEPLLQPVYPPQPKPMGYATFYLLLACILLYFMSQWTVEHLTPPYPKYAVIVVPLLSSPTKKALMYDYPKTYEIVDDIAQHYGPNSLGSPESLPESGKKMYLSVFKTPFWDGIYPAIVAYFQKKPTAPELDGPLFEKLREGEIWRPLTPIFLHGDIFHLLFNMLWLVVLGKQMEQRLGIPKFLTFVIVTGIFSNTAQYIVSGPNFIGFSGVLCAMLAYIWDRQRTAPWEGYQLQQQTIRFIFIFIFGMAAIQFLSFLAEVGTGSSFAPGIANTAHLSGALIGYLMSRWQIFSLD